ncbi:YitT family protein [Oribacterium sp. HCP28S3_H8]|uniref:YitT family protein n=1 Tax=Oribacterium sp. HCP28S3_H8 TaxID=3438945 RepID=UPI003F8B9C09
MLSRRTPFRDYLMILVGAILVSIASKNIYDPAGLVTGGVGGLAIIIKRLTNVPLWVSNTIINIPLFIGGYFVKGWKFLKRTLFATMLVSLALILLPDINLIPDQDFFLASVFGGILMGVGSGLVFVAMATTGGTDLLAAIIQSRLRHVNLAEIMQVLDSLIVILGIGMFGVFRSMYAIVSIYIFSRISSNIIDGMHFAKVAYIISRKSDQIADKIIHELDRGVTGIPARGMYSGRDAMMLYCVVSNREAALVQDLVRAVDPEAFVIISDVREVHGEGFTWKKQYGKTFD